MATIVGPAVGWQPPKAPPSEVETGVDWPIAIAALVAFTVLLFVVTSYLYPDSESGRFDRCVQQRVETFLEKADFPVIPAVRECGELREQGALGN